mmetsp:Transcript_102176/g.292494  ORF Transcript_102176/g.292494 Transcript_102176/m.292494 type:complete len:376 (-) Transcript_102176:345-1472(-)
MEKSSEPSWYAPVVSSLSSTRHRAPFVEMKGVGAGSDGECSGWATGQSNLTATFGTLEGPAAPSPPTPTPTPARDAATRARLNLMLAAAAAAVAGVAVDADTIAVAEALVGEVSIGHISVAAAPSLPPPLEPARTEGEVGRDRLAGEPGACCSASGAALGSSHPLAVTMARAKRRFRGTCWLLAASRPASAPGMVKLAPAVLLRWSPATPADGNVTAATTAENGRASAAEALPPPPKPAAPEHLPPVRRAGALDEVAAAGSVGTSSAKLRGCGRLWEALWRNFVFAISCGVPSWARPWKWSDRRPGDCATSARLTARWSPVTVTARSGTRLGGRESAHTTDGRKESKCKLGCEATIVSSVAVWPAQHRGGAEGAR